MRIKTTLIPILFLALISSALADDVETFFSPRGGCRAAIVERVNAAQSSILVEEYSFTEDAMPIAKALVKAAHGERHVAVQVILNRGRANRPIADYLNDNRIPVMIDYHHTNHNKVMVIDGEVVITGSYNLSENAEEKNGENLVVIHGKGTADDFTGDWKKHSDQSEPYPKKKNP